MFSLGNILLTGATGVPPNPVRSVKLYKRAIVRGQKELRSALAVFWKKAEVMCSQTP